MKVLEVVEGVSTAWKRTTGGASRKFRCKSGPRKGRVMASPAACNAPINRKKSASLTRTKSKLGKQKSFKSKRTRRVNPYSRRLKRLNK
jgi:hypothetical protein